MGQKITWEQMLGGFSLLPLVIGLRAMASYFSTYCLTWVSARVIRDMQVAALRKAQELSMAFFQKMSVAYVIPIQSSVGGGSLKLGKRDGKRTR
jgi:ABC-type multidrug transport system fused ATPase/permease subunit